MRLPFVPESGEVAGEAAAAVLGPWLKVEPMEASIQRAAVAITFCAGWIAALTTLSPCEAGTPAEILDVIADGIRDLPAPERS